MHVVMIVAVTTDGGTDMCVNVCAHGCMYTHLHAYTDSLSMCALNAHSNSNDTTSTIIQTRAASARPPVTVLFGLFC